MNINWIISGASAEGFEWNGGETISRETGRRFEEVFGEPNFLHIWWHERALSAARSVARVKKLPGGSATGFLIAPDLFLTNNHVFETAADAEAAKLQFDYRLDTNEDPLPVDTWECDPDSLFKTNPELDYSIVRVKPKAGELAGDKRGFLNPGHGMTIALNRRVNIIQHPQGLFQQIAFRDNQVKATEPDYIQYITDTDYGSSGSPVFDDFFRVVALHSQRVRDPSNPDRWHRNQGFRIERIIEDAGL
jgi:endonuclease G